MSYETKVAEARARKRAKYNDLVVAGRAAGYRVKLITLEVGSRGMLGEENINDLREAVEATTKELSSLCLQAIRAAILDLGLQEPGPLTSIHLSCRLTIYLM